jgi:hypothetical protein
VPFELAQASEASVPFELTSPDCVRWAAAGAASIEELHMLILDPEGVELGRDELVGNLALIAGEGPVCLGAGKYSLRLSALRGSGKVLVRGFRTARTAPGDGGQDPN